VIIPASPQVRHDVQRAIVEVIAIASTMPMITSLRKWWFMRMRVDATTAPTLNRGMRQRGKANERLSATATTVAVWPDGNAL